MRIALFSSHRATRFKMVMDRDQEFRQMVKLFYSDDPGTLYLKPYLEENSIQYELCDWRSRKEPLHEKHLFFSDHFLELLKMQQIDYVFCNGSTLLEGDILNSYEYRMITFHAGLLPWYAGPKPIDRMLKKNEFLMGTAAIFINSGIDSGPIIMESVINGQAAWEEGYDAVTLAQVEMIPLVYRLLKEDRIRVENGTVKITGADYHRYRIFPSIE